MLKFLLILPILSEAINGDNLIDFDTNRVQNMDCQHYMEDGYFYANCSVYANCFPPGSLQNGPYQSIKVNCHLKSFKRISMDDHFLLLQILEGQIMKVSEATDKNYNTLPFIYIIPFDFFFPLVIVNVFDVKIKCTNQTIIGVVYRRECNFTSAAKKPTENFLSNNDVSECFGPVKLSNDIVVPFNKKKKYFDTPAVFKGGSGSMIVDALTDYKTIWLDDFGCTVQRLAANLALPVFPANLILPFFNDIPIHSLILNGNKFEIVSMFPSIPLLNSLLLSQCGISSINETVFHGVTNLTTLDLSYNRLKSIPLAIQDLPHLLDLSLEFNQLSFTDAFKVRWPPNLITLNLSGNPLQTQYLFSLNQTSKLQQLALRRCDIDHISFNTFPPLESLLFLDLSENNLTTISTAVFRHFPSLQSLDLSKNHLKSLYSKPQDSIRQLISLNLSGNAFTGDRTNLTLDFIGESLQILDLSNNEIATWMSPSLFRNLPQLQWLDLSSNNISELNSFMTQSLKMSSSLKLSNNAFDCSSCQLMLLQQWLRDNRHRLLDETDSYICRFPTKKYGMPLMKVQLNSNQCLVQKVNWVKSILPAFLVILLFLIVSGSVIYYYKGYVHYYLTFARSRFRKHFNQLETKFDYMFDAYISYADADSSWLSEYLLPEVENKEPFPKLFIRDRNFLVGSMLVDGIPEAIDNSRKCIFILSDSFLQDTFRNYELEIAIGKDKVKNHDFIIVIRLDPVNTSQLPKAFQPVFSLRTYLDWPQDANDEEAITRFWVKLKQAITGGHPTC